MYLNIGRAVVLMIAVSFTCIQLGMLALAIGMMSRPDVKKADISPWTGWMAGFAWGLFYFLSNI